MTRLYGAGTVARGYLRTRRAPSARRAEPAARRAEPPTPAEWERGCACVCVIFALAFGAMLFHAIVTAAL